MKYLKTLITKIPIIIIIVGVMLLIGVKEGRFFGYAFSSSTDPVKSKQSTVKIEEAKILFPKAVKIAEDALKQISVFGKDDKLLGYIISSKPYSDSLVGFAGPVHFIIGIDTKNNVVGIKLTDHAESPGYIEYIEKEGFFEKLKNQSLENIINNKIDAVTGATMTTEAIIKALKQKTAEYNKTVLKMKNQNSKKKIGNILSILVLGFALLSFFTKKIKRYRLILLLSSVLILGFLNGSFISIFLLHGWIQSGIPLFSQILIVGIVVISIVIPLLTNKSFYCNYVCPYGAIQELAGKIRKRRMPFPFSKFILIKHLRSILFLILVVLLVFGFSFDLTNIEPFSAFIYVSASYIAIILALVFIVLSVFFNKPWCYYFCPSGQFLALLRIRLHEVFHLRKNK